MVMVWEVNTLSLTVPELDQTLTQLPDGFLTETKALSHVEDSTPSWRWNFKSQPPEQPPQFMTGEVAQMVLPMLFG